MDSRSASSEKRQRVDLLDLKDQREGEAHIFFKSRLIRARMFFANPPPVIKMRLNHFLKVEAPPGRVFVELDNRMEQLLHTLSTEQDLSLPVDEGEEIQIIADSIASQPDVAPIERSLTSLLAFHNRHAMTEPEAAQPEEEEEEGELSIFSKVNLDDTVKMRVDKATFAQFSEPLVNKAFAKDKLTLIERMTGRAAAQASQLSQEVIKDMALATSYPPPTEGLLLPSEEVVAIGKELCDYVTSLKSKTQKEEE